LTAQYDAKLWKSIVMFPGIVSFLLHDACVTSWLSIICLLIGYIEAETDRRSQWAT